MRHRLRAINDDAGAVARASAQISFAGLISPRTLENVAERHDLRPTGEQLLELVEPQTSLIVDIDDSDLSAGLPRCPGPGHQVRVVFRNRQDDLVAGA
jgi:hypothetical protein